MSFAESHVITDKPAQDLLEALATLLEGHAGSTLALVRGLSLGQRAAELLAIQALGPVAARFPATIQELLAPPASGMISVQDAFVEHRNFLRFLDLLELSSQQDLAVISPRLYRGWQDRKQARRDARDITTRTLGFALDAGTRDRLLLGLAIHQRLYVVPPPLDLDKHDCIEALSSLLALLGRLAPRGSATHISSARESLDGPAWRQAEQPS